MIRFSFSSFCMSLLFANFMILILYLTFRNQKLMMKLGLPILGVTISVTVLRMLLPIEFLHLSHNICLPEPVSMAISKFLQPKYFGGFCSYWSFVKTIWLVGILVSVIRIIKDEYGLAQIIYTNSKELPVSAPARHVFDKIQKENPRIRHIKLRTIPHLDVPIIYGLRRPCILLPENLDLNEIELYYILQHEAAHYLHHDLFLKIVIKIFCTIYWWNPLCKSLQEQAEAILEMRVDHTIAKDPYQKIEYLTSLQVVMEHMYESTFVPRSTSSISFCDKSSFILRHRIKMLLDEKTSQFQSYTKYILISLVVILFILSFTYIFEPYYISPQDKAESIIPDANNSYFIEKEDGTYELYLNDEYYGTMDSLEYFDRDITIYKKGDEIK